MTVYDQPATSFSDTTGHQRVISNAVFMLSPKDTPFILAVGGFDAARNKFRLNGDGEKIELIEDALAATSGTAAQGTTILTNDVALTVADASVFQDGDVIQFDSEYDLITAVDTTNNTITLATRTYGGTNATHASTVTLNIVAMNRSEGDTIDYRGLSVKSYPYNYMSRFEKGIKVTGTMRAIDQYAISDEMAYQRAKAVPELSIWLDKACYHGVRVQSSSSVLRSSMGGLTTFITGNTLSAGGAITKTVIDSLAEYIEDDGGTPDIFVCHPSIQRDLRDVIDNSSFVNLTYANTQIGMSGLKTVVTAYGSLALVMDRHCPTSLAFMLDSSKVGLYALRPFFSRPMGVTGDFDAEEVIGEFSLMVANGADGSHGYLHSITT